MWVGMESTRPHEKGCPSPPQIDISHRKCHSLCKRQIIPGNLPEPTLGIDSGTEWIQSFFRLHLNQSIAWCPCQCSSCFLVRTMKRSSLDSLQTIWTYRHDISKFSKDHLNNYFWHTGETYLKVIIYCTIHILGRSVKRDQVRGDHFNGDVTSQVLKFSELLYEGNWAHFFLTNFSLSYWYAHEASERKEHSLALIYFQVCKCRAGINCLSECE